MSSVSLLGHFEPQEDQVYFQINQSKYYDESVLNHFCQKLNEEDIDSLTVEYDNNSFVQFLNENGQIRFIEGDISKMASLQSKLKQNLEGEIISNTQISQAIDASIPSGESATDHGKIHSSFFQDVGSIGSGFSKVHLYFQPFEDPGGDLYWTKEYGEEKYLVVVGDCTGHGLQGAMTSMAVLTLLKQHYSLPPTDLVNSLYEFHEKMQGLMEHHKEISLFDVELGVLLMDRANMKMEFAGSGISLFHKNQNKLAFYRSRKTHLITKKLKSSKIDLHMEDQFFIFTDGITDQFDAKDEHKLGIAKLTRMIESAPMDDTANVLKREFLDFKGDTRQMDDQTMLILTI